MGTKGKLPVREHGKKTVLEDVTLTTPKVGKARIKKTNSAKKILPFEGIPVEELQNEDLRRLLLSRQRQKDATTPDQEEERDQYYRWKSSLRDAGSLLGTPMHISNPWAQALSVLNGNSREWHQRLVRDLVDASESDVRTTNGLELLHATLRTKPNFQTSVHLQHTLDFLRVITHASILDCLSIETYVGTLYNIIGGVNGDRAISFFTGICDGLVEHSTYNKDPKMTSVCLGEMLNAMYELLRREKRATLNPDLPTLLDRFGELLGLLGVSSPHDVQIHSDRISRLRRIADLSNDRLVKGNTQDGQGTSGLLEGQVFPHNIPFPNGRHDNDHRDISQISIMPTPGEIANGEIEYLPSTDPRQVHFLDDPVQRYLDTHFRLLRHDILGPLKDTLGVLMSTLEQQVPLPKTHGNELNAHIYQDASVAHIAVNDRRGFEAHISFTCPPQLNKKSNAEKKQWWDNCKRLEPGGLVSLMCLDGDRAIPLLLVVTDKSTDHLKTQGPCLTPNSHQKPTIGAKLASNYQTELQFLIRLYQGKTRGILVDVPGLIPATFVPILGNLQRMVGTGDLPFQEWIVPKLRANSEDRVLLPPQYARRPGFSFSLRSISNAADGAALSVKPTSLPNDTQLIDTMEAQTGLDRGQCQAMVAALTREFACIQGPPGTGKSYMGVKLLQVLLDSKTTANLGPIIIICYTNHALDQFLKHLLAVGITRIVRIGGKSRCPELDAYNLRARTGTMNKTRHESYMLGRTHGELDEHMERMGRRLGSLHKIRNDSTSHQAIRRLLKRQHPAISRQFDATDEDGFTKAGRDPLVIWASAGRKKWNANATTQQHDITALVTRAEESGVDTLQRAERQALIDSWLKEI
ncbi:hypothetical protein OQA88_10959 [Cercophora sp. LCS_1]